VSLKSFIGIDISWLRWISFEGYQTEQKDGEENSYSYRLHSQIDDVTQINVWTKDINEVLSATVESLSEFRLQNGLQIDKEGYFLADVIVTASLELSDYFAGDIINESADVNFSVQCKGIIEKSSIKVFTVLKVKQHDE
jgi:hypothetical protein